LIAADNFRALVKAGIIMSENFFPLTPRRYSYAQTLYSANFESVTPSHLSFLQDVFNRLLEFALNVFD
jgi:hypothetical protein